MPAGLLLEVVGLDAGAQETEGKMVVMPETVMHVGVGVTGLGHWSACAKSPVAKAVFKVGVGDEATEVLGDVVVG